MTRFTTLYVSCSTMRNGTPRDSRNRGQHVGGKARLLLVEVHRDDLERERRPPLERQQDVEQAVAVLASGHADHHAIVRRDEVVRADRLADLAAQALPEFVRLEFGFPRVGGAGRPGRPRARGGARRASAAGVSMGPSFYRRGAGLALRLAPFGNRRIRETPMQTILVANPKGGSGKTTLATNVAGWLAGKRQDVVLRDLDPQRSATEWLERRPALFPRIAGLARDAKHAHKDSDHDWRVVDTPAGLHGDDLRDAVRRADVMLVPLTPSAFDMAAAAHFLSAIHEAKAIRKGELALGIVAMRVDPRTRERGRARRVPEGLRVPGDRAPARHAGVRPLRARRRVGLRPAALARRAGLGAVEAADALDRAAHGGEGLSRRCPGC